MWRLCEVRYGHESNLVVTGQGPVHFDVVRDICKERKPEMKVASANICF